MQNSNQFPRRIISEEVHDSSGKLIGQQIYEIHTKSSSNSIHRTVKLIHTVKGEDGEFKNYVMAEAMAIFPAIIESETLMEYLSLGFKEYLNEKIDTYMKEHAGEEELIEAPKVEKLDSVLV